MRTAPRLRANLLAQRAAFHRLRRAIQTQPLHSGFTLIELLVVVIIIAVLTTIVLPAFLNQQNKARVQGANSLASDAARSCAAMQITGEHTRYVMPPNVSSDSAGSCPASGSAVIFFTTYPQPDHLQTNAAARVSSNGSVQMVTCAAAAGVTTAVAPVCSL